MTTKIPRQLAAGSIHLVSALSLGAILVKFVFETVDKPHSCGKIDKYVLKLKFMDSCAPREMMTSIAVEFLHQ